jgi:HSP20 family protein
MAAETKMEKTQESKAVAPTRPSDLISRWEQELEHRFDEFWRRPLFSFMRPEYWLPTRTLAMAMPALDVYEEKDEVVVKAELPGMAKEDIEVHLTDSTLFIQGEKKKQEEVKNEDYQCCERSYGSFARTIELPTAVKAEQVKATFKEGVLEVRLPKTEEAKQKTIQVAIT